MSSYKAQCLSKDHIAILQACSPTTRTHSAIGSAALNVTTTQNSDWLELYPFMSARMFKMTFWEWCGDDIRHWLKLLQRLSIHLCSILNVFFSILLKQVN